MADVTVEKSRFKPTKFMTAGEKEKILNLWIRFLKNGLQWQDFTKQLYHHLSQNCDFIAHYNIHGFYEEYFITGADKIRFLNQFDRTEFRNENRWYSYKLTGDYGDLNSAMVDEAEKYLPVLYAGARTEQKNLDLALAEKLLARHGFALTNSIQPKQPQILAQTVEQGSLF